MAIVRRNNQTTWSDSTPGGPMGHIDYDFNDQTLRVRNVYSENPCGYPVRVIVLHDGTEVFGTVLPAGDPVRTWDVTQAGIVMIDKVFKDGSHMLVFDPSYSLQIGSP